MILTAIDMLLVGVPFLLIGVGTNKEFPFPALIFYGIGTIQIGFVFFIFSNKGWIYILKAGWIIGKTIIAYLSMLDRIRRMRDAMRRWGRE